MMTHGFPDPSIIDHPIGSLSPCGRGTVKAGRFRFANRGSREPRPVARSRPYGLRSPIAGAVLSHARDYAGLAVLAVPILLAIFI